MMRDSYKSYINFVIQFLVSIIGFKFFFMIISIAIILQMRGLFKTIYSSFLNITEGEFEERTSQLTHLSDALNHFKQQCYYRDFLGTVPTIRAKTNTNKPNKKYVNQFYCFRLFASILFLVLFYLIQICISGIVVLFFNSTIDQALWVIEKQHLTNDLVLNQLFLRNGVMQRLVMGKESQGMNKTIDTYLGELSTQVRKDAGKMYEVFEKKSGSKGLD